MSAKRLLGMIGVLLNVAISASSQAAEPIAKVILLTSINSPKVWFRGSDWEVSTDLEKEFRSAFRNSGFSVEVKHGSGAWDLWQALHDRSAVGIFWLSHAGSSRNLGSGTVRLDSTLLTADGLNVKALLQKIPSRLKYFALIGCRGDSLFKELKEQGYLAKKDGPVLRSFDESIDAMEGLRFALNAAVPVIGDEQRSTWSGDQIDPASSLEDRRFTGTPVIVGKKPVIKTPTEAGNRSSDVATLHLIRKISQNADPNQLTELLITMNGNAVGVLKKPLPGEEQELEITVPEALAVAVLSGDATKRLSLVLSSSQTLTPDNLGRLRFTTPTGREVSWQLFADSRGFPIGDRSALFRYQYEPGHSELPWHLSERRRKEFSECTQEPARVQLIRDFVGIEHLNRFCYKPHTEACIRRSIKWDDWNTWARLSGRARVEYFQRSTLSCLEDQS